MVDYCLSCKELTSLQSCKRSLQIPDRLLELYKESTWSPSGVHQDSWGSVSYSNLATSITTSLVAYIHMTTIDAALAGTTSKMNTTAATGITTNTVSRDMNMYTTDVTTPMPSTKVRHGYTMGQDFPHHTHICMVSWQCLMKPTYINYKKYYYH